jgi:hypothetical protein
MRNRLGSFITILAAFSLNSRENFLRFLAARSRSFPEESYWIPRPETVRHLSTQSLGSGCAHHLIRADPGRRSSISGPMGGEGSSAGSDLGAAVLERHVAVGLHRVPLVHADARLEPAGYIDTRDGA